MSLLPNVTPAMLDPEFWLSRLAAPDAVLLDDAAIATFNAAVPALTGLPDPFCLPEVMDADAVRALIAPPPERPYFDVTGAPISATVLAAIHANMALETLPGEVPVRFGLTVQRTHLRAFPTALLATAEPGDISFDEWQETSVDVGWPVAALHTSADGRWLLAVTPIYYGWLRADHVALAASRDAVRDFVTTEPFAVAIASESGVALPDGDHVVAEMGTRLPLAGRSDAVLRLRIPRRDEAGRLHLVEGYAPANEGLWHVGYLPCTQRSVLTLAFSMLGEAYAWGGMRLGMAGRDCSHFVMNVWGATGVRLPRNSGQQGKVGVTAIQFLPDDAPAVRAEKLCAAPAGAWLLLPGHVMLHLGVVDGRPYAIHDLWRYRKPDGDTLLAGRVVVSDLPIEPSERRHTLLERLTHAQFVR